MKSELCIMPENDQYSTTRFNGSERHEVFGAVNRDKSIKYGLVIFITPEQHRTGKTSIHLNPNNWLWLKGLAQKTWRKYYNKTKEDFIKEFGRNYE